MKPQPQRDRRKRTVGSDHADTGERQHQDQTEGLVGPGNPKTDDVVWSQSKATGMRAHRIDGMIQHGVGDRRVIRSDDGDGVGRHPRDSADRLSDVHAWLPSPRQTAIVARTISGSNSH